MTSTIAVKENTLQMLNNLKGKFKAKSLDETIIKIIKKIENIPDSGFGVQPKLKSFKESERATFREY